LEIIRKTCFSLYRGLLICLANRLGAWTAFYAPSFGLKLRLPY